MKTTLSFQSNPTIDKRLAEFKELYKKGNAEWFSELCFCILTANSQAKKAISIQQHLGPEGFLTKSQQEIANVIRSHAHRFHNNKAKYIFEARKYKNIKTLLTGLTSVEARNFIVKNVKGLGYKEASHFLRNVGYDDVAIIDRHILRFMHEAKLIKEIPKTVTPAKYLEFERILGNFGVKQSKLDLIIWERVTGEVLK